MKKLLIFLLLGMFLISLTSAYGFSFSTEKSFDKSISKYGRITLTDENILTPDKKLAEYTLIDNTDYCLVNCYAEGEVKIYHKEKLFSNLKFNDLGGRLTNIQSNKILISNEIESYDIDVNDYKEVCNEIKNGTSCENKVVETHKETRERKVWKEYNGEALKEGTYYWRIEGKKAQSESVDWIATSYGKELTEWATWTSSFNVNLVRYYNFSADGSENTGNTSLKCNGNADYTSTGGISNSGYYNFISGNTDALECGHYKMVNNFTLSTWIKTDASASAGVIVERFSDSLVGNNLVFGMYGANTVGDFTVKNSSGTSINDDGIVLNATWTHYAITYDGANVKWYVQGVLNKTTALSGPLRVGTGNFSMGTWFQTPTYWTGGIDEVGLWTRDRKSVG
jgi:hypothetical protein